MLEYAAVIGDFLKPDNWRYGEILQASGDDFSALRLPTCSGGPIRSLAVSVKVTGRLVHWQSFGNNWVRAKITFLGDGEPNTTCGARLYSPNF